MRPFKRTDIKSEYYYVHVGRTRVCTFCTDLKAASLWVKQRERAAVDPGYEAAHRATVSQALDLRLAQARRDGRTAGTLDYLEGKTRAIALNLGASTPLSQINAFAIDAFIDARQARGVSRHTLAKELKVLRTSLRLAKRGGLLSADIDSMFPTFGEFYRPRERTLTEPDALRLIEPTGGRYEASSGGIAYCLGTGARAGEAERAQPGDLDWNRGLVLVRGTKSARFGATLREVPITKISAPYLRRAEAAGWGTWTANGIYMALQNRCESMKIEPVCTNDLRRTFATWHRNAGVPLEYLAPMMGHTTTSMLERVYARLKPESLGELLGRYQDVAYLKTVEKRDEREPCETPKTAKKRPLSASRTAR